MACCLPGLASSPAVSEPSVLRKPNTLSITVICDIGCCLLLSPFPTRWESPGLTRPSERMALNVGRTCRPGHSHRRTRLRVSTALCCCYLDGPSPHCNLECNGATCPPQRQSPGLAQAQRRGKKISFFPEPLLTALSVGFPTWRPQPARCLHVTSNKGIHPQRGWPWAAALARMAGQALQSPRETCNS